MQVERLRLDAGFETKEFYKWIMNNSLTAKEIALWHALMYIADEAGYPIWLSVALTRLEKLTGMKKDSIYTARDKLEQEGRIEILQGQGNQAAKYRIISFASVGLEDEPTPGEVETQKSIKQPPMDPVEEPPGKVSVFRRMQEIIPMPPSMDIHHIKGFIEEGMEEKLLCEAIDITLKAEKVRDKPPMDKWYYFKGIIRSWYNNSIMTYEEYQEHEKEREKRINSGGNRKNPRKHKQEQEHKESGIRDFRIPE